MIQLDDKEDVARVLKPIWLCEGVVSPSAFNLRPHIHESYISVLRHTHAAFVKDVYAVARGQKQISYALTNTGELRQLQVDAIEDKITFDVAAIDNQQLTSHAGVFIYVNNQQVVGGEPFESLDLKHGVSVDSVLLSVRDTLADYAQNNIQTITNSIFGSDG